MTTQTTYGMLRFKGLLISLFISINVSAQFIAAPNKYPLIPAPNYALLSNVDCVLDATGLRVGRTNSYGETNSAGTLTTWQGISPGDATRDFSPASITGGSVFVRLRNYNGVYVLATNGDGSIRCNDAASTFDYLSYNATFANLKWTVHMVARIGWGADPGDFYGIMGNNGSSQSQKGIYEGYDQRPLVGSGPTHMLRTAITKGTTGFISTSNDNNKITPNQWHVYTWTFDGSLSAADRQKFYVDGTNVPITVTSSSTAVVTTPTRVFEIFNVGNNTLIGPGEVSHVIFQSGVESDGTRDAFVATLMPFVNHLTASLPHATEVYQTTQNDGTKYFFPNFIGEDPTTPGTIMKVYRMSLAHITDATGALYYERSTDWGRTWSAPATFYDPDGASPLGVGGACGGYDATGRLWIFCEVRTTNAADMLPYTGKMIYTDDNAATSPTVTDVTANLASMATETQIGVRGNIIVTASGRLMLPYYLQNPATTSSSNHVLVSDDDGATWQTIQVRASSGTYRNEGALVEVTNGSTTRIINQVRDEVTGEWHVYSSTDDGDNWTDDGAQTLGETFTTAHPVTFSKFMVNGTSVVCVMYSDRSSASNLRAIYQKESSLASAPLTWDLDTKITLWGEVLGYGLMFHPYNSLRAIGLFYSGTSTTENKLVTAYIGTSQITNIISELGL